MSIAVVGFIAVLLVMKFHKTQEVVVVVEEEMVMNLILFLVKIIVILTMMKMISTPGVLMTIHLI